MINLRMWLVFAGVCLTAVSSSSAWCADSTQVTPPSVNPGTSYVMRMSSSPFTMNTVSQIVVVYPKDRSPCPSNLKAYLYMTPVIIGSRTGVQGIGEIYMEAANPNWEMTWVTDHYELSVRGWYYYKDSKDSYRFGFLKANWLAFCGL